MGVDLFEPTGVSLLSLNSFGCGSKDGTHILSPWKKGNKDSHSLLSLI